MLHPVLRDAPTFSRPRPSFSIFHLPMVIPHREGSDLLLPSMTIGKWQLENGKSPTSRSLNSALAIPRSPL
jgi:hypothetical protein